MTMYYLLTVAGTFSLAFGGNFKDRLSYSEDNHDYPSKKWASDKHDDYDRPSGYGHAYAHDPYERTYGTAYSMHGNDDYDKHYDGDYRSSKQWKRPSYSSKRSRDWKKDDYKPSDKHGHAYSYDPYERTYGNAYSTNDYKKDHIVKEPKVTAAPEHWKKSDYSTTDYSKPTRNWKKNDGKYGSKYSSKDEPKHEPKGHKDYSPKDYKDEPKHEPKGHKDSKDEPKDYDNEPSKEEPKDYEEPQDDDGNYGTAYSALGGGAGARCTQRSQCSTGCCEGPYGQGRCVEKKIDW